MPVSLPQLPSPAHLRQRLGLLFVLGASITLSVVLITFRVFMTQELTFVFLLWNLFLALIPSEKSTYKDIQTLGFEEPVVTVLFHPLEAAP